jgi:regulatory protein
LGEAIPRTAFNSIQKELKISLFQWPTLKKGGFFAWTLCYNGVKKQVNPMKITAVEKIKDKPMLRVFVDERYAFTIPQEDYIIQHLYEEMEFTEEQLEHIKRNVLIRAARQQAIRYLTMKDRTQWELQKKLTEAGYDDEVAQAAIEELKTIGYLDDARYALKYLSERSRMKSLSRKALRYELERKGVDRDIIEASLREFEVDDEEVALRAARKKFGKYDLKDPKTEKKVLSFLFHRGFSGEVARKVFERLKEQK